MVAAQLFEPSALRGHRLFESRDLDDARERISRVMQPHVLVPRGPAGHVRSHMDFVRVGGIGVGTIAFGAPMRVDVDRLDGYYLLMFCLRGHSQARPGDWVLDADARHGIVGEPDQPFVADLSADCEQLVLRIDREVMLAHAGHEALQLQPALDLNAVSLRPWLSALKILTSAPAVLELVQRNALIAGDIERLLIHLLLAGQPWQASLPRETHGPAIAPACVRRAEAFMEAQVERPLRLADIAAVAGVPARTLHDAFQRFRGMSPLQRLHEFRLQRAHWRLRGAGEGTRVAEVALDCGFAHFGRFAQAYKRRFGESPSRTLQRRASADSINPAL
jgi:AraC-like DNA-binding protein